MKSQAKNDPEWLRLVRIACERLGCQRLVGDLLGVKGNTVSDWLAGKVKEPKNVEARIIKPLQTYLTGNPVSGKSPWKRERIWQAMRILRTFTHPDLVATAEASLKWVAVYTRKLTEAGYLRLLPSAGSSRPGRIFLKFRMVKDTGPKAPSFTLAGFVDPNLFKKGKRR